MSAGWPSDEEAQSLTSPQDQAAYCASVINCRPAIAEKMLRILGNGGQVVEVGLWTRRMLDRLPKAADSGIVLRHARDHLEALLLGFEQVRFGRLRILDALSGTGLDWPEHNRNANRLKRMIQAAAIFVGDRK